MRCHGRAEVRSTMFPTLCYSIRILWFVPDLPQLRQRENVEIPLQPSGGAHKLQKALKTLSFISPILALIRPQLAFRIQIATPLNTILLLEYWYCLIRSRIRCFPLSQGRLQLKLRSVQYLVWKALQMRTMYSLWAVKETVTSCLVRGVVSKIQIKLSLGSRGILPREYAAIGQGFLRVKVIKQDVEMLPRYWLHLINSHKTENLRGPHGILIIKLGGGSLAA